MIANLDPGSQGTAGVQVILTSGKPAGSEGVARSTGLDNYKTSLSGSYVAVCWIISGREQKKGKEVRNI